MTSLDALQTEDMRKIMDVVDELRRAGVGSVLQLPQLVVCGDQSYGKSSVSEAITEIPFPRKENLCTRFATEIILRQSRSESISTKIIPDKSRPLNELKKLKSFKKTISSFEDLPILMDEATKLMGLGDDIRSGSLRAFSRNVLSIEICGPGRTQLTLVDLPGLIHSANKNQSKKDVDFVRSLVHEYIGNQRTIILAVVSAKNDYANQIILKKARDFDQNGSRTLGLITKSDFLDADSENELSWIEPAQNKDIYFELGWHILKNRSEKDSHKSFEERNRSEELFFSKCRHKELVPNHVGIVSLRARLSTLLHRHLKQELPQLQKELDEKYKQTTQDLQQLGDPRSTLRDQKRFLMKLGANYKQIVDAAMDGHYETPCFGHIHAVEQPVEHPNNLKRVRAVIQHLNLQFARQMAQYGSKYKIIEDTKEAKNIMLEDLPKVRVEEHYAQQAKFQISMKRTEAIKWVQGVLERTRGQELPGNFNPSLISELFQDLSSPWKDLAIAHIIRIDDILKKVATDLLEYLSTPDISFRLQGKMKRDMAKRMERALAELEKIDEDRHRHPITYNGHYTLTIQKQRNKRNATKIQTLAEKRTTQTLWSKQTNSYVHSIDSIAFAQGFESEYMEYDMDKFSAEDAFNCQLAYYKDELKYFVGVVTKQVIERCLIHSLAGETLSQEIIGDMTAEDIKLVAEEPEETTCKREYLEGRKYTLENDQNTFRSALGIVQ
ncbi:hypothetical protein AOQ84DRAFT_428835 [Glonium stellatum]|uniref:Uncharacterized protein n=1 Tax=Glonium stellatum TaxID=574774 RepID=A0A8E2FCR5_9PEZI|nr:hypothetical protein AOQ84DRAFT_428835 [Glonium stellatum]